MKSAAGGQLASDIGRLAESLNLPRSLFEPGPVVLNGPPFIYKSCFALRLVKKLSFMLKSDVLYKQLFFSNFCSVKEIKKIQAILT
jgi:hypothetical protein